MEGSYHWNFERALSVATVPLMATAFAYGPIPMVDFALGFVLPLHCHFGFEAMITDYFPARRTKTINTLATWTLRVATALAIYGCFAFNTTDIGITAFIAQLWSGKKKE